MRQPITGKHLNNVTSIDIKTGKETKSDTKMMLMPAKEGTCEQCSAVHEKGHPHNAQSIFYQYWFYNEYGRWPNWKDAMSHCTSEMKNRWTLELEKAGVNVEKGEVNPKKVNR